MNLLKFSSLFDTIELEQFSKQKDIAKLREIKKSEVFFKFYHKNDHNLAFKK